MGDLFGCCSLYVECSDAGNCLRDTTNSEYSNCGYRRNLEKGLNFYSKKKVEIPSPPPLPTEIYLTGYNQPFAIRRRVGSRSFLSWALYPEDVALITCTFEIAGVPFITTIEDGKFRDKEPNVKPDTICNSRVVLIIDDHEYHLLAHNCYLIPQKIAQGFVQSLQSKGITCRCELVGKTQKPEFTERNPPATYTPKEAAPIKEDKKPSYEQSDLFSIMLKERMRAIEHSVEVSRE